MRDVLNNPVPHDVSLRCIPKVDADVVFRVSDGKHYLCYVTIAFLKAKVKLNFKQQLISIDAIHSDPFRVYFIIPLKLQHRRNKNECLFSLLLGIVDVNQERNNTSSGLSHLLPNLILDSHKLLLWHGQSPPHYYKIIIHFRFAINLYIKINT